MLTLHSYDRFSIDCHVSTLTERPREIFTLFQCVGNSINIHHIYYDQSISKKIYVNKRTLTSNNSYNFYLRDLITSSI